MDGRCLKHNLELDQYCTIEDVPFCPQCAPLHKGHPKVPLSEKARLVFEDKKALAEELVNKHEKVVEIKNKITETLSELNKVEIIHDKKKENLLNEFHRTLEKVFAPLKEGVASYRNEIQQMAEEVKMTQERIDAKLQEINYQIMQTEEFINLKEYAKTIAFPPDQPISISDCIEYKEEAERVILKAQTDAEKIKLENVLMRMLGKANNTQKPQEGSVEMNKRIMRLEIQIEERKKVLEKVSNILTEKIKAVHELESQMEKISVFTDGLSEKINSLINDAKLASTRNKFFVNDMLTILSAKKQPGTLFASPSYICAVNIKTKTFHVYSPVRKSGIIYLLDTFFKDVTDFSVSATGNSAFFTGGISKGKPQKCTYEFLLESSIHGVIKRSDMPFPVSFHTTVPVRGILMYSIGGVAKTAIKDCACYDVVKDTWKKIKPLPIALAKPIVCKLDENLLACWNVTGHVLEICLYNTVKEGSWITYKTPFKDPLLVNYANFVATQVSPQEILLFGAKDRPELLSVNLKTGKITEKSKLPKGAQFKDSSTTILGEKLYVIDTVNKAVYSYNIVQNTWRQTMLLSGLT